MEQSGLLNRLALFTLSHCGTSDRLLLLGFMIPTAFCSMWISDTATTAMMVKTVKVVLDETKSEIQSDYHAKETDVSYGTFSVFQKDTETNGNTNLNQAEAHTRYTSSSSDKFSCHSDKNSVKCKCLKCQNKDFQKR